MKTIKLDKTQVENLFKVPATTQGEILIGIFKMLYPDWDEVEKVDGYPECNERTWKQICQLFIDFDTQENRNRPVVKQLFPAGLWISRGFSAQSEEAQALPDWHVIPANVIYRVTTKPKAIDELVTPTL